MALLSSRSSLPLSELRSVRRALNTLFPADRCLIIASSSKRSGGKAGNRRSDNDGAERRPTGGKGFGAPVPIKEEKPAKLFEDDNDEGPDDGDVDSFVARPEYQLYSDVDYKPKRYIGDVEAVDSEGTGRRSLVAKSTIIPGDLVLLLPALSFLEGEFQQAPEPEDLHMAMLEDGLTAAQRRVLDAMDDGSGVAKNNQASMTTLDVKFWSSRGNNDPSAPAVDAGRLLQIIKHCCCIDTQQDTAAMQVRQQTPSGFIGLWPEFSLLPHSCVPNTSLLVVGDRLLVHAAGEIPAGTELTRNCIGPTVTAPLQVRRAAIQDERGYKCNCPRCKVEEGVSEDLRQVLADAFSWYTDEGLPQWNQCQETEDLKGLQNLWEEAEQIVAEVEEAVQSEEGLEEEQRMWLRASAYDCYDMLVMCDEFLNQDKSNPMHVRACLELIRVFAPGSESHTGVAVKYDAVTRTRAELAEYLAAQELDKGQGRRKKLGLGNRGGLSSGALVAVRQAKELKALAEEAGELYLEAFFTRYGFLSLKQLETLREGLEMYTEALEQMSLMQAEGKTEEANDYMIDGVKFSIVDKLGSLGGVATRGSTGVQVLSSNGSAGAGGESGYELANQDGVRLMIMDQPVDAAADDHDDGLQDIVDVETMAVEDAESAAGAHQGGAEDGEDNGDGKDGQGEGQNGSSGRSGSGPGGLKGRLARRVRRSKD